MITDSNKTKKTIHPDVIRIMDAGPKRVQVVICEDEPVHAEQLRQVLDQLQDEMRLVIELYDSTKELLAAICDPEPGRAYRPDVIFLDIRMPELDGITFGKTVRKLLPDCFLIFTTAYEEYAIEGYEAQAFRYLLKPVNIEMIQPVMQNIQKILGQNKKLLIKSAEREQVLPIQELIYLSAEDKYTILYTKEGHFVDRKTLNEYQEMLKLYGFYRIHRKYIVNSYYHKSIQKGRVILSTGTELPVSRRREKDYYAKILQNLEKELML